MFCAAFGPEGLKMRRHIQAAGKEPSKVRLSNTALKGCGKYKYCSKPACLGQRNNNGPLKTARSPKAIYSPRNTFTSPCQCTTTAVSETSCMARSSSSQLAVFQSLGIATTAWRY